MGDIIITEFEKVRVTNRMRGETIAEKGLFFLILTIILLVVNQIYIHNLVVQAGLAVFGFVTAFRVFFCRCRRGIWRRESGLTEYSDDMACIQKVLDCLDIDTYNKLGLVMDEVRARITYGEAERKKKEIISSIGILGVSGTISCICLYRGSSGSLYVSLAGMISFFLIMSGLLLTCLYISADIFSINHKYKQLYELLLNVMITKF